MSTKTDKELAYEAGQHAARTEPPERRHPDACPFPPGDEQRVAWLQGFKDAVDEVPDPRTITKALSDALSAEDALS